MGRRNGKAHGSGNVPLWNKATAQSVILELRASSACADKRAKRKLDEVRSSRD
jgi:hypothetical protein